MKREPRKTQPLPEERREREQQRTANEQREWGGAAAVEKHYATAAAKLLAERLGNRLGQFLGYADKTDPAAIIDLLRSSTEQGARLARVRIRETAGTAEDEPPLPFMNVPAQDGVSAAQSAPQPEVNTILL